MKIVSKECIIKGDMEHYVEIRRKFPLSEDGTVLAETRSFQNESDFLDSCERRISNDSGKNWSEWEDISHISYQKNGDDEIMYFNNLINERYNPVHKHYLAALMERTFIGGHENAYNSWWSGENEEKESLIRDIAGYSIRKPLETEYRFEKILYDGEDAINHGYFGTSVEIMECGDILIPIGVPVKRCCEILDIDVNSVFPSCPETMLGCIIARGKWNTETEKYDFTYSKPIVISDLLSSRGLDEPTVAQLKSGRIIVVFRGSNIQSEEWNTRIEPGAPALKWYAFSDDGGKTFSPVMPWRMDSGDVIHSPASISLLIKSPSNETYWIGNITGPETYGNMPRFPLVIGKVDETYGTLIKDSIQTIDTRREGETRLVQLSNFYVAFIDGMLEITLTKYGQFSEDKPFHGDTWRYRISFDYAENKE